MKRKQNLIPVNLVEKTILFIRGQKVILDADLARLYGSTTKRLNEQVRRNCERFPEDFIFQLTKDEKAKVVANCDHLSQLKFSLDPPNLPEPPRKTMGSGQPCFSATWGTVKPFFKSLFRRNANFGISPKWL